MRGKSETYIEELDIGNPIEHWIKRAHRRAGILHLPEHLIDESAGIIVNAFGREWLEEQFVKPDKFLPFTDNHRIVEYFKIAGDIQIVTLMEIAEYFRTLRNVPGIDIVLRLFKNKDQYFSTFFQLAYAYRFMKLGVLDMKFEPPIDEGRYSDIFFLYKNRPFLVECFCPSYQGKGQDSFQDILKYSAGKLFDAAKKHKTKIFYQIRFFRKINPKERKEIVNICITSLDRLLQQESGDISLNHDACEIRIFDAGRLEKFNPARYKDILNELNAESDFGCSQHFVRANQIERVRDTLDYEREESSKLFMKRPPDENDPEWITELGRKIEGKVAQIRRRSDSPQGVLIVNSGIGLLEDDVDKSYAKRLQYKILGKHSNIDAVILSSHKWMVHQRNQFISALLLGPDTILFGSSEILTANFLEDSMDLLKGWPTLDADEFISFLTKYIKGEINNDGFRAYWSNAYARSLSDFDIREIESGVKKFIDKFFRFGLKGRRRVIRCEEK